ncbi:hypothetical protein CBER1_09513 [Cercospora berteroae]|uniref:Uncharacterized protein n=1 Tax=Cercospora berteroae TaxID=357750 RepID=A0A2S6CJ63_9PEZI|nr:hypothetical protein CBER1_09513 [Cercospora berteroae]
MEQPANINATGQDRRMESTTAAVAMPNSSTAPVAPLSTGTDECELSQLTAADSDDPDRTGPRLLVDQVMMAISSPRVGKLRKRFLRSGGDVIIVLDRHDLSISCRIRSEDLRKGSAATYLPEPDLSRGDGVRYLCVLDSSLGEHMPRLAGRPLSHEIREGERVYSQCNTSGESEGAKEESTDHQKDSSSDSCGSTSNKLDWIRAYETFLRMLSHVEPKYHLINSKSARVALPQLEALSRIAAAEKANLPSSAITTAAKLLFAEYPDIWPAIAEDPARWLMIAENFHVVPVFKEAILHLVGQYPSLSVRSAIFTPSESNMVTIGRLATQKYYHNLAIDHEILLLTSDDVETDSLEYTLLAHYLEWVKEHIRIHGHGKSDAENPSKFCDHKGDAQCLQPAHFYLFEALGERTGEKLSSEERDTVREYLKTLKAKVSSLVEPMVKSYLQYDGKHELPYLTNVSLSDKDMPWMTEEAGSGDGSDTDEEMEG